MYYLIFYNKIENKYLYRVYSQVYLSNFNKETIINIFIYDSFLSKENYYFQYCIYIPDIIIFQLYKISEDSVFRKRGLLKEGLEYNSELIKKELYNLFDKYNIDN